MTKYSYKVQFIDKSYCIGETELNIEEFYRCIDKQKGDLIILCGNLIINKRNVCFIEISKIYSFGSD